MTASASPAARCPRAINATAPRDLIDEHRLFIHPVILGNGKRLFADGTTPTALKLIDTQTTSRGVVVHVYQPSGKPEYGAALLKQDGDVVKGVTSSRSP